MVKDEVLSHFKTYLLYLVHDEAPVEEKTFKVLDDCCKLTERFPDEALPIEVICEALLQGCECYYSCYTAHSIDLLLSGRIQCFYCNGMVNFSFGFKADISQWDGLPV